MIFFAGSKVKVENLPASMMQVEPRVRPMTMPNIGSLYEITLIIPPGNPGSRANFTPGIRKHNKAGFEKYPFFG
jgi:hypothetical protein